MGEPYIGVDFDGVLAKTDGHHEDGYKAVPVERMVNRVKKWIKEGKKIKIITARAASGNPEDVSQVHYFLHQNGIPPLEVTASKDPDMVSLWDDKAVAVEKNTGIPLSPQIFSAAVTNIYNWDEKADEPVSSVVVLFEDSLVIVANSDGEYMLPTGHAEKGETPCDAAVRELEEETGIKLKEEDLVFVTRTSLGDGKYDAIFAARVTEKLKVKAGDDADKAKWVKISECPKLKFGQSDLIEKAILTLNSKPESRGLLVVFEGLDGSGKSTQIDKLSKSLFNQNIPFTVNKWNSAEGVSDVTSMMKKQKRLSPQLFFLMHAADMIYRWQNEIMPALARNEVVLCDRYYYTGIVRDAIRGIDPTYNKKIYDTLRQPDVLFYCKVDPSVAVKRLIDAGDRLSHYSSGMDVGTFGKDKESSALGYEKKMDELYNAVIPQSATGLDCSASPDDIAYIVEAVVSLAMARKYDNGETLSVMANNADTSKVSEILNTPVKVQDAETHSSNSTLTPTIVHTKNGIQIELKSPDLESVDQKLRAEMADLKRELEALRNQKPPPPPKPKAKIVTYHRDENGRPTGMTIREEE